VWDCTRCFIPCRHGGCLNRAFARSGSRDTAGYGCADRAGLWLIGDQSGAGTRVMLRKQSLVQYRMRERLDISMPFFRAALDSLEPVRVEFDSVESMSMPPVNRDAQRGLDRASDVRRHPRLGDGSARPHGCCTAHRSVASASE